MIKREKIGSNDRMLQLNVVVALNAINKIQGRLDTGHSYEAWKKNIAAAHTCFSCVL